MLELEVLSLPQGMDGVADCREDDPALPVIVRPAGNGLSPEVLVAEPVKVLASENDVLRVSEGYLVSPMAHWMPLSSISWKRGSFQTQSSCPRPL